MLLSVCEVQDLSKLKSIRNSMYMTFPYIMYKINDLLKMDNIIQKYNDLLYEENSEAKYLILKHSHDIHIDKISNDQAYLKEEIQNSLSFDELEKINKMQNIVFIKDM